MPLPETSPPAIPVAGAGAGEDKETFIFFLFCIFQEPNFWLLFRWHPAVPDTRHEAWTSLSIPTTFLTPLNPTFRRKIATNSLPGKEAAPSRHFLSNITVSQGHRWPAVVVQSEALIFGFTFRHLHFPLLGKACKVLAIPSIAAAVIAIFWPSGAVSDPQATLVRHPLPIYSILGYRWSQPSPSSPSPELSKSPALHPL